MSTKSVDPRDKRIGQNVRRIRMLRSMSQEKLGNALDLTFQQIQKYEKGTNRISGSRLQQIADALTCTVPDLFDGVAGNGTVAKLNDPLTELAGNNVGIRMAKAFVKLSPKLQHMIVDLCEHQSELVADTERAQSSRNFDRLRARAGGALG